MSEVSGISNAPNVIQYGRWHTINIIEKGGRVISYMVLIGQRCGIDITCGN
jgi:hypothetical protein